MKIYDVSQELLSSSVYPGDPTPTINSLCSIESGDLYNLSAFSMCAHNGTHIDAPLHFIKNGKSIDEIDASVFVGKAFVAHHDGLMSAKDAEDIMDKAKRINPESAKRILIKGNSTVTDEAARIFADNAQKAPGYEITAPFLLNCHLVVYTYDGQTPILQGYNIPSHELDKFLEEL